MEVTSEEILSETHYFPIGAASEHDNRYLYNGKELNSDFDLNLYDYGARWYDPAIGGFISVDPLAEQRSWVSPYNYVQNNPILRVDLTGALDNPIYDTDGNFLGPDDRGLQGDAIVMNAANFTQGMSHNQAMAANLGTSGMSEGAQAAMASHFSGLSSRPDYDGFVTVAEGVEWAKANAGALADMTADNILYIDASKLDFGDLYVSDLLFDV